jgi:hypothetical protein
VTATLASSLDRGIPRARARDDVFRAAACSLRRLSPLDPEVHIRRLAFLCCALVALGSAGPAAACGLGGYAYAGVEAKSRAHGVAATISTASTPYVAGGHVAGWVGVGGAGFGPDGSDAWLQVGLATLPGLQTTLYYEVAQPGAEPDYNELNAFVAPGERHRVAVLETSRSSWWRVWVDGRPATEPILLAGSHGTWEPTVTGESWDGGASACNAFDYRFERVEIATRPAGGWQKLSSFRVLQDPGLRLRRSTGGFLATMRT